MKRYALTSAILLLGAAPSFADTDVASYLNAELAAKKIMVNKVRTERKEWVECHFEGPNGRPHRECNRYWKDVNVDYTDQARVTNVAILNIQPLKWEEAQIKTLPATANIQRLTYSNCGDDPFSTSVTLQVKGTHANSVSKTHSLSTKSGLELRNTFKAGNGIFGGETSIGISLDVTTSDSTTNAEQFSSEETRTWAATINPAPGHSGYLQLLAIQQSIEVPFSTTIIVDADLEGNSSGLSKASQVLSEAERTMPFDGVVKATQLSDSYAGNYKPDVPLKCDDPQYKGKQVMTKTDTTAPLDSLDKVYAANFGTLQKTYEAMTTLKTAAASHDAYPEGISGQIVYSTDITVGDAKCGFDPRGQPKLALHTAEFGNYYKFENGVMLAQWDEWLDNFKACLPD